MSIKSQNFLKTDQALKTLQVVYQQPITFFQFRKIGTGIDRFCRNRACNKLNTSL